MVYQVCSAYMVTLQGFDTWADLILLDMLNFDIILGMDWLTSHHAMLDCYAKTVTLVIPKIFKIV